ncbi:MAG: selB [Streptosporangiaceae bacterium]|nr:selB [Streptosporangiaceae bacterium]
MQVIATAGHVDHGKSTLLRALTGMEPDRWAEERRRGLTIDLGFVWTSLDDGSELAFVDVPGHERFVTNMLAGVGAVPAVLFVVAADSGWQAQTQEHLDIITALGIRHGLLAVTRADLADPAAALTDASARLAEAGLRLPGMPVSAVTGLGLPELRAALAELAASLPPADPDADVRLWIDRVFSVTGRGTVVTGTLGEGTVRTGDRLHVPGRPEGLDIRGIQALQRSREAVSGPARVALNLRGRGAEDLRRGDALTTFGTRLTTEAIDVRVGTAERLPAQVTLHIGAAAVPARVRPLGQDTARLTLREPLPLRIGDRALLRDAGSRQVIGAVVLDVRPPALRRRGAAARRAAELETMTGVPDGAAELRRRGLLLRADLIAMGAQPPARPVTGDWLADPEHWVRLRDQLAGAVKAHAERHPQDPGLTPEAARQALDLPHRSLVDALAGEAGLQVVRGRLVPPHVRATLRPEVQRGVDAIRRELADAPFRAPDADRLAAAGLSAPSLAAAEAAGQLLRIAPTIALLPDAADRAMEILASLPQPFTAAQARAALGTTRRVAIPLLEHLDRRGLTSRDASGSRRLRG